MNAERIILDTDVVSFLMKGGDLADRYLPHVQGKLHSISFITVAELYYGAEKKNWGGKRRLQLEQALRNYVVIPYDHEIARCYARLVVAREKSGRRIEKNDAWIAACAVRHDVALVTHNAKHFRDTPGLRMITAGNEKEGAGSNER